MILRSPRASSVYLIFALIHHSAFPPVPGANDSNDVMAVGKPNRHDPTAHKAKAIMTLLICAVRGHR